jgi:hypothetical protein
MMALEAVLGVEADKIRNAVGLFRETYKCGAIAKSKEGKFYAQVLTKIFDGELDQNGNPSDKGYAFKTSDEAKIAIDKFMSRNQGKI